jgi:hypothetical protein
VERHNDYSLLSVFLYVSAALLEGAKIGTASFLHCIERDDYTDKHYVSSASMNAAGYNLLLTVSLIVYIHSRTMLDHIVS